jgi:hypothetical protein
VEALRRYAAFWGFHSGLLWNLMKTCPELKAGMKKLGFTAPYL